jgi:hypothetical protein
LKRANLRRNWSTILKATPAPTGTAAFSTISRHVSPRGGCFFTRAPLTTHRKAIKKTRQWWRVSGRLSAYAHDRHKKQTRRQKPKLKPNPEIK